MTTTYPIDSIGRDANGADSITVAGNHASDFAGGISTVFSSDGSSLAVIPVSAYDNGGFTEVLLPPRTLDFNNSYVTVTSELPDPEPEQSIIGKFLSIFGK